jgi:uncharacterized protein
MSNTKPQPNKLANESSLYLRQHAQNPVDWHPWGEEALEKAKTENKPLLISIGYSACHWCHVMEHESFNDSKVAEFMNRNFVNIKIDREERPDLDQLYMEAVQLLHGQGGWPLNCFALPDGRPFWGATYFKKDQWMDVLDQITVLYQSEPDTLTKQAENISAGIGKMNLIIAPVKDDLLSKYNPENIFTNIVGSFDAEHGGFKGAPKFPMPSVYRFLLHYYHVSKNITALEHVILTLEQMATGGIYDQVGGGFARYSTDKHWKVPHFEKMLYDNAQLITLYCEAFLVSKNEDFSKVAFETIQFLEREMGSASSGFASAIDADSPEGEGTFYTFTIAELDKLLGKDAPLLTDYWKAGKEGLWEEERNILLARTDKSPFLKEKGIDTDLFDQVLKKAKTYLLNYRKKRPRPTLDPKIITSWNAFMIEAYVNLYRISFDIQYLEKAKELATFVLQHLSDGKGRLYHVDVSKEKKSPAFLEDFSALIRALIILHSASLEGKWLIRAKIFTDEAIEQFYDAQNGLFFYTGSEHEDHFSRRQEIHDNVIPSSNSIMMECLLMLGQLFEEDKYLEIGRRAVTGMAENIMKHPSAFSNWARALLMYHYSYHTLAIAGKDADSHVPELLSYFLPQTLITGERSESRVPILKNRIKADETAIYVCSGKECYAPVYTANDALKFLNVNT